MVFSVNPGHTAYHQESVYRRYTGMRFVYHCLYLLSESADTLRQRLLRARQNVLNGLRARRKSVSPVQSAMSLKEIEWVESQAARGALHLTSEDRVKLNQLKTIIGFFHKVYPDSDPDHTWRYSLDT